MVAPRVEKAYEKYAWILLLAVGMGVLILAVLHLLGFNPDPTDEERVIGMTLGELKASNPRFFDFYTLYNRVVGLLNLAIALPTVTISATAYRRVEKWAWYALWNLPVVSIIVLAVFLSQGLSSFAFAIFLEALILMGLILPYRKFFPRKS